MKEVRSASAAAMFDVLWSLASYERLAVDWQMDREQTIGTLVSAIELIAEAVRSGRRPSQVAVIPATHRG